MADKREFLAQLDRQAESLQASIDQITAQARSHHNDVANWRSQRAALIQGHVERLLPDLQEMTISRLARSVPGFVTQRQVDDEVARSGSTYQTKLDKLLASFDPLTYENRRIELDGKLAKAETDLADVRGPFGDLVSDDDVSRLIGERYGMSSYPHQWWEFWGPYYSDWKAADEAVERFGLKDWKELAKQYEAQLIASQDLQAVRANVKTLNDLHATYEDLRATIARVPGKVLEQLRVKLSSWIDSQEQPPASMSDVEALTRQIAEKQQDAAQVQAPLAELNKQLTKLRDIRSKASRSRKREVPDEFVRAFNRPPSQSVTVVTGGSIGYGPSYSNYNDGFVDALLLDRMLRDFDEPHRGYGRGYDSGYQDAARDRARDRDRDDYRQREYASARDDRSGQS